MIAGPVAGASVHIVASGVPPSGSAVVSPGVSDMRDSGDWPIHSALPHARCGRIACLQPSGARAAARRIAPCLSMAFPPLPGSGWTRACRCARVPAAGVTTTRRPVCHRKTTTPGLDPEHHCGAVKKAKVCSSRWWRFC